MNLQLFMSNCCGDCPDKSKIPILIYHNDRFERTPRSGVRTKSTSKSQVFYDCKTCDSKKVLKAAVRSASSSGLKVNYKDSVGPEKSFMSIDSMERTSSAMILKQCKNLLENYSLSIPASWANDSILGSEDLDLLRQIIGSNERYNYLSQDNTEMLKNILENANQFHFVESKNMAIDKDKIMEVKRDSSSLDEAWNVIEELFKKRSESKGQIGNEVVPALELEEIESYLNKTVSDCCNRTATIARDSDYTLPRDFDPLDMIDGVSICSADLQFEDDDYAAIDYSEMFTAHDYVENEQLIIKQVMERLERKDLTSKVLPIPKMSESNLSTVRFEWYAVQKEIKQIVHFIYQKSTLLYICDEYELKYLTFEELQKTGEFYKISANPKGLEFTVTNFDNLQKSPEELFGILKPWEISNIDKRGLGDIDRRFEKIKAKLQRVQDGVVPEDNVTDEDKILTLVTQTVVDAEPSNLDIDLIGDDKQSEEGLSCSSSCSSISNYYTACEADSPRISKSRSKRFRSSKGVRGLFDFF